LLEGDVDDVVFLLAEGTDIDIADQCDFHRGGFALDLLVDGRNVRRRRHLGVRQIEAQRGVEQKRQFLVVQHRRDADAVRRLKHKPDEGRLHRGADANRGALLRLRGGALLAQCALGGARALGQFADYFGGKAGRLTAPCVRQQIDEHPPAVMVLMVTLRVNDSRIAEPSGSRRTVPT
jgi:hypothetical protein